MPPAVHSTLVAFVSYGKIACLQNDVVLFCGVFVSTRLDEILTLKTCAIAHEGVKRMPLCIQLLLLFFNATAQLCQCKFCRYHNSDVLFFAWLSSTGYPQIRWHNVFDLLEESSPDKLCL